MGVARQASTLTAAGLVEELKAERENKREHELDKRLGITKELKVRCLILKIDADSTVVACLLGGWSHLSPPLRWSLTLMRHHGGNVLKYQECCEIRRVLPLNPMECGEGKSLGARTHRHISLGLVPLCAEHQVNCFVGCDYNITRL